MASHVCEEERDFFVGRPKTKVLGYLFLFIFPPVLSTENIISQIPETLPCKKKSPKTTILDYLNSMNNNIFSKHEFELMVFT